MKVVVIGGGGFIGSKVVDNLRRNGHEAVAGSPASGLDTATGQGLAQALVDADVVVDVADPSSWEDQAVLDFFETSCRLLLGAEAVAGVKHHVALSIIRTDWLSDSGYVQAKVTQESLIKASRIPYTIVRSTQFFEFLGGFAETSADGQAVRLSSALVQPIAADDVAATLAEVAVGVPVNGIVEVADTERWTMTDLVQRFLDVRVRNAR